MSRDHKVDLRMELDPEENCPRSTAPIGDDLEPTRRPLEEARHLPGYMYWAPEVFLLEKDRLFMVDWLAVGRVEEIENPGDYFTWRVFNEPIIVARDGDGEIHAFMNRCAHRGAAVARGRGNTEEFTCPYHGWLYDRTGRLVGAPHMRSAKGFDPKKCRLEPLHVRSWGGWIYVNFAETPAPFEDFIAPYEQDFGFLRMENCRLGERIDTTVNCNWKFITENLMDNYHSEVLHKETIGANLSPERFTGVRAGEGAFSAFYKGRPMTWDNESRFGPMPWIADRGEDFACSGHLVPNMHLFARCDNVHPFVIWPLTPTRTRVFCYQLFPREFFSHDDFWAKVHDYTAYTTRVLEEDASMMDSLQDAAMSERFRPGRMSERELGVYNLLNYTIDRTFEQASE